MDQRFLVIGGGIGGLATAITLLMLGRDVELIEREADWSALGAGLTFNGATARAFRTIGVFDEIAAVGFCHGTSRVCDKHGQVIVESSTEEVYGPGIPPMGGILRPVLHEILKRRALDLGLRHKTGVMPTALDMYPDRSIVGFSDGTSGTYELVVGADGLRSWTRDQIFPEAEGPRFTGQGSWRAVSLRPAEVTTSELYFGTEFKAGINPVSQEEMYLFLLDAAPGNPWIDPSDWLSVLKDKLQDFGGHVATLREQLDNQSRIVYRPLETVLLPDPWYKNRVLLVGDAVHGTTPHVGYGAGLAVEDAVVLGELLADNDDIDNVLIAFMKRRYQRCFEVVTGSIGLGELEMRHAPVPEQRALSRYLFDLIKQPA